LESDWPYIRQLKLKTSETVSCPICLAEAADIIIPKILKCHHVFCFTCIVKYFLDFKQTCPICLAPVCLRDVRSIKIETVAYQPGDTISFVLMKKNMKSYKVDFCEAPSSDSRNFLNRVHSITEEDFENLILTELSELHSKPGLSETDSLVIEFCQFINLKSIEKHRDYHAPHFLGKRTIANTNKTQKEEYVYFYQDRQGVNIFMHPIDFAFVQKSCGSIEGMPNTIDCMIVKIQKIIQNSFYRKHWPQFSHIPLNFDLEVAKTEMSSLVKDFNKDEYEREFYALQKEIAYQEKVDAISWKRSHQVWRKNSRNADQFSDLRDSEGQSRQKEELVFMRPKNGPNGFDQLIKKDTHKSHKKHGYVWKPEKSKANDEAFEIFEIVNAIPDHPNDPGFARLKERYNSISMQEMFPELPRPEEKPAKEEATLFARMQSQIESEKASKPKPKPIDRAPDQQSPAPVPPILITKVKKKAKGKYQSKAQD